jgi:hypothetical protein
MSKALVYKNQNNPMSGKKEFDMSGRGEKPTLLGPFFWSGGYRTSATARHDDGPAIGFTADFQRRL